MLVFFFFLRFTARKYVFSIIWYIYGVILSQRTLMQLHSLPIHLDLHETIQTKSIFCYILRNPPQSKGKKKQRLDVYCFSRTSHFLQGACVTFGASERTTNGSNKKRNGAGGHPRWEIYWLKMITSLFPGPEASLALLSRGTILPGGRVQEEEGQDCVGW